MRLKTTIKHDGSKSYYLNDGLISKEMYFQFKEILDSDTLYESFGGSEEEQMNFEDLATNLRFKKLLDLLNEEENRSIKEEINNVLDQAYKKKHHYFNKKAQRKADILKAIQSAITQILDKITDHVTNNLNDERDYDSNIQLIKYIDVCRDFWSALHDIGLKGSISIKSIQINIRKSKGLTDVIEIARQKLKNIHDIIKREESRLRDPIGRLFFTLPNKNKPIYEEGFEKYLNGSFPQ